MTTPILKTEQLIVRAFEQADLPVFAHYRAQEEVARYQSWTDYSYQDALDLFNQTDYSSFGTAGHWYQLAIAGRQSNQLLGDIAVHFMDDNQVEMGFTVAPQNQGQHIATQAVSVFLVYLFTELNKHRVVATTDTRNVASCRLLEKLGFRREAHFIQNIFFKGAWGDEYQYALLQSEQRLS
ncbi:GNAT family N-acetyltransferase [Neptunicella sp. SCSIO 80796]|uniref:GNAT family N-acetyltransferase n=1 Tax=Neptunicella plasticusilytica TaxID=3117012 RepID=UPI003A4D70A4